MSLTSLPITHAWPVPIGPAEEKRKRHFPRHLLEPPELTLTHTFYPMGFPLQVRTNEAQVLTLLARMWGRFEPLPAGRKTPLRFSVHVVDSERDEACPPAPVYRLIRPLLLGVADGNNYSVVDLATLHSQVSISRSTLKHPLYAEWFLLSAPLACISSRLATPIHGACISRKGRGVLLCGESGAGKSTLAYACARAGWTYTSDDATLIPHPETGRRVIGNCHQVRLRPTAAELFPEIVGRDITPRAAGKPSIELPTAELPNLRTSFNATVQHIVFLDRSRGTRARVDAFPLPVARRFLRGVLFGLPDTLAIQYEVLERMITAPLHRLRYEQLDDAVALLEQLVDRGRA